MIKEIKINIFDLINNVNVNYIESILYNQKIFIDNENYKNEFEYRYNFELKKYLLRLVLNQNYPLNFIYLVDSMEILEINNNLFYKVHNVKINI